MPKEKLYISKFVLLILAIIMFNGVNYFVFNSLKKSERKQYQENLEKIFDGKKSLTHYRFEAPHGSLKMPESNSMFGDQNCYFKPNERAFATIKLSKLSFGYYESLYTFSDELIISGGNDLEEYSSSKIIKIYSDALNYLIKDEQQDKTAKEAPTQELEAVLKPPHLVDIMTFL